MKYKKIALGGTFDRFHRGHAAFLTYAMEISRQAVIGVTNKRMIRGKYLADLILPYSQRIEDLKNFIKGKGWINRVEIIALRDQVGPLHKDSDIEAVVVTEVTKAGAENVNRWRKGLGLRELPIEICPMVKSDDGKYLSSTRIRKGEVSRSGIVYLIKLSKDIKISNKFRTFLQREHGVVIDRPKRKDVEKVIGKNTYKLALVGDVSVNFFVKTKLEFAIGVFDRKVERKRVRLFELGSLPYPVIKVANKSGVISEEMINILRKQVKKGRGFIFVKGEEDLAAPVLVLLLPLNAMIVYGVPDKGLGILKVTEELKNEIYRFL